MAEIGIVKGFHLRVFIQKVELIVLCVDELRDLEVFKDLLPWHYLSSIINLKSRNTHPQHQ